MSTGITHRLKVAGFLLNIAEWDRHIEVTRQILNGIEAFEPYAAFLRLTRDRQSVLDVDNVVDFLSENGVSVKKQSVESFIKINDTKLGGGLSFEDFLKMTLARDNPKMRFEAAAKRDIYEVAHNQKLSEEIEYTLARLFTKSCEFVEKMRQDAESQTLITERTLFAKLVGPQNDKLDFNGLKRFFTDLKIVPKDSEIIAILRIIDINDDGIIDKAEFDYFIGTVGGSVTLTELAERLRMRQSRERSDLEYSSRRLESLDSNYRSGQKSASKTEPKEYQSNYYQRTTEIKDGPSSKAYHEVRSIRKQIPEVTSEEIVYESRSTTKRAPPAPESDNRYEKELKELRDTSYSGRKSRYQEAAQRKPDSPSREYTSFSRETRISPIKKEESTIEKIIKIEDNSNTPTRQNRPTKTYERTYRRERVNGASPSPKPVETSVVKRERSELTNDGTNIFHSSTYQLSSSSRRVGGDARSSDRSGRKADLTAYSPVHEHSPYRRSYANK